MARGRRRPKPRPLDFVSLSRPDTTSALTEQVQQYWIQKRYSCHVEVGLVKHGNLRADVMVLNTKGQLVILEIKSSWADFRTDKKWQNYLEYCEKFYFCLSHHLYETHGARIWEAVKESGAGIMVCSATGKLRVKHRAKERTLHYKRKQRLYIKMAWRGGRFN